MTESARSASVIIIGIAGASGSGKSLLANTIVNELGSCRVGVISEDSYYKDLSHLPKEARNEINFDHPDAFDHELLIQHISALKAGEAIEVPIYDYVIHNRTLKSRRIDNKTAIIVLEGILLFIDPALYELMDIRIFMDTPPDTAFIRRLRRDVMVRGRSMESVISQYEKTVRPMFTCFVEPSKRHADVIVPHGGENRIAISLIQAKIKELLSHHPEPKPEELKKP